MRNLEENDEEAMLVIPINGKEKFMPGVSQNSGPMPITEMPKEMRVSKVQKSHSILIKSPGLKKPKPT